jgi:hypothetical protein
MDTARDNSEHENVTAGGAPSAPRAPSATTERSGQQQSPDRFTGGWRGQSLVLKILLVASLAAMTIGIVRCSLRVTAPGEATPQPGASAAQTAAVPAGSLGTGDGGDG